LYYRVSGIITHIGVTVPEAVQYNFALLTMSTFARNAYTLEIYLLQNLVHQVV